MAEKVGGIYYEVDLDTAKMVDGQRRASRELDGLSTRLTATSAAVAILAAGLAALKIAKLADEIRLLSARAEVAAGSIEAGAQAMNELIAISRRTQTSLTGNVEVFNRLNQSILQMGGNQRDTLVITELLSKAIKVSGANAVESKAAMLQFGQALGSGKLAGDELRSLMETAPYLMRKLADGIGVPVGALKQLGEEGKLTADVVTNALSKAADQIDADFQKFPQTVESAMIVAQDSAALAAAKFDELSGSSAALTGVVQGTGQVLDELAKQFDAASGEADKLGRNDAVSSWADQTRTALSYVADAADVTWQAVSVLGRNVGFVFSTLGSQMGGIAAMVAAAARGEVGDPANELGRVHDRAVVLVQPAHVGGRIHAGTRGRTAQGCEVVEAEVDARGATGAATTNAGASAVGTTEMERDRERLRHRFHPVNLSWHSSCSYAPISTPRRVPHRCTGGPRR